MQMVTCDRLIKRALQKTHAVEGGGTPDNVEATDALETFQSYLSELFYSGKFGRWVEVRVSEDYTAEESESIGNTTDANVAITLPEEVEDLWEEDGVRRPRDLTPARVVGDPPVFYLYNAAYGAWVRCSALTLSDNAPLSDRSVDGLAAMLAARLSEEYTLALKPGAERAAQVFHALITHKRDRPREETEATYY
jgi:hypothetical protein